MKFICLAVIVLSAVLVKPEASGGFGYELIISALESIQSDVRSLKDDLRSVAMQSDVRSLKNDLQSVATKVYHLKESQSALAEQFIDHMTKMDQLRHVIVGVSRCPQYGYSGTFHLKLPHSLPLEVYCENGWIVIHRRFNGSLDFNRKWVPYREGFGDLQGEHWLGLENMHQITRVGFYELKVVLKSYDGLVKTAQYEGFKIGSETEQYQLNLEKFVEGDAGDSLMHHNTRKFATMDRGDSDSCAPYSKSGWWFRRCYRANLNAIYKDGQDSGLMKWYSFNKGLKEARMLIRAVEPND